MEPSLNDGRSDAELAAAVLAGSLDALGRLYERHAESLYRTALRFSRSRADAEDVVQDVFVGLRHALGRYREDGRLVAWMRRVTVRRAIDRRRRADLVGPGDRQWSSSATDLGGNMDLLDGTALREALAALPDTLRDVFLLKEREGYSHAEIAELLGIQSGTSAVRLHRAHRQLRRLLQ